jgi:predicted esterase
VTGPPVAHHLKVGRTARYFTQGEIEGAAEVWFVLHGYSMLAASFLQWFAPVAVPGRLLVAPEGLSRSYFEEKGGRRVGASWMTKEDRDAEIEDYLQYLDRLAERIRLSVSGQPRVEIHGFSQGAATACRWIGYGSMPIDRLVVWGSKLPPELPLERFGDRLTRAGLTICIGDRDKYIAPAEMDQELARLAAAGLHPPVHRFDGGHRVDPTVLRTLTDKEPAA